MIKRPESAKLALLGPAEPIVRMPTQRSPTEDRSGWILVRIYADPEVHWPRRREPLREQRRPEAKRGTSSRAIFYLLETMMGVSSRRAVALLEQFDRRPERGREAQIF